MKHSITDFDAIRARLGNLTGNVRLYGDVVMRGGGSTLRHSGAIDISNCETADPGRLYVYIDINPVGTGEDGSSFDLNGTLDELQAFADLLQAAINENRTHEEDTNVPG